MIAVIGATGQQGGGVNPLFPFPDRLPSVFSVPGEKANSWHSTLTAGDAFRTDEAGQFNITATTDAEATLFDLA